MTKVGERESPTEPGKRSRLWSHEDINQVLQENKVSKIYILNDFGFSSLNVKYLF